MHPLDIRSRAILKEIIRLHVDTGKPVSSRALFKSRHFELSPASIRNIMADLTDAGFLAQPHTSAGRIPTDRAYRLYIDELMKHRRIAPAVREQVDSDLASAGSPANDLRALGRTPGPIDPPQAELRGARWGANGGRRRATQADPGRRLAQLEGISSYS